MKKIACPFDVCSHLQIEFSVLSKLFAPHNKLVLHNSAPSLLTLLMCTNVFPSGKNPNLLGSKPVFTKTAGSNQKHYLFL